MTNEFDKTFWEERWQQGHGGMSAAMEESPPNPYLVRSASNLTPGTALDAGCGAGAEAIWLATQGWQVTGADISRDALDRAIRRTADLDITHPVSWVEADLTVWSPDTQYDLVTTHYAHPSIPQLAFYDRISNWVALGGTLLIVGHLHSHGQHGHGHEDHPPAEASVRAADVVAALGDTEWEIVTADEQVRAVQTPTGQAVELRDVVVQATRRAEGCTR